MKCLLLLLAALLAVTFACKKEPAPNVEGPAAPPAKPAPRNALDAVPLTESTLSLLEPQEGRCQWVRLDPGEGKRAVVASFDGDCKGARVAWSADGKKGLVWFDPDCVQAAGYSADTASPPGHPDEQATPGATPRLFEVTFASGEVRKVSFPQVEGEVRDLGYRGEEVVALALQSLSPEQAEAKTVVDGKPVSVPQGEGQPGLAQVYRLESDGAWKRVEVKGTREGAEGAPGLGALTAASALGPRSVERLDSTLRDEGPEPTGEQLAKLLPWVPPGLLETVKTDGMPEGNRWAHGVTPAGAFYVWQVTGDALHNTGHLVLERGGEYVPVKDLGFTDGRLVSVTSQGRFLLVASERAGTHPRLYDLRTGKRTFSADTARATTFWPKL